MRSFAIIYNAGLVLVPTILFIWQQQQDKKTSASCWRILTPPVSSPSIALGPNYVPIGYLLVEAAGLTAITIRSSGSNDSSFASTWGFWVLSIFTFVLYLTVAFRSPGFALYSVRNVCRTRPKCVRR